MVFLFDIGGTKMRFSYSEDGVSIGDVEVVENPKTFDLGMEVIEKYFERLTSRGKVKKMGGGVAAVLDKDRRRILSSYNLPDWSDRDVVDILSKKFDCGVHIENDAALGALGEAAFGAGRGYSIVAYLTIGTGVGGARVVDGEIDQKCIGFEPGHHIVNFEDLAELDDLVSGGGMQRLSEQKGIKVLDGDEIWERRSNILAVGIYNTVVYWSPEVIILGGGLIEARKYDVGELYQKVKRIAKNYPFVPPITKAQFGDKSVLMGALKFLEG
jgi:predicted NBD/HSP70 family sugar kinase